MRSVNYRAAATAFVFTVFWFLLGLLLLISGLPSALDIGRPMFVAWVLIFFVILGVAGMMLTLAAFNGMFPPARRRVPAAYSSRPAAAPRGRAAAPPPDATDDAGLPWSASPLADRGAPARRRR